MDVEDKKQSEIAWKNQMTREHLDELYLILSHVYGGSYSAKNVPYCKDKKFAFIDTEYLHRNADMKKIKSFFNPSMKEYWEDLVKHAGK